MFTAILFFAIGVAASPFIMPYILPVIDKVKGMVNKLDPDVSEKDVPEVPVVKDEEESK